jgi:phage terminase small subunit
VKKVKENDRLPQAGDNASGLTGKQRFFIESYLSNGFNATEAARSAGYEGNDNVLGVTGHENLRNPKIAIAVQERLNEAAMSANEVLARLSKIARGEVTDFLDEDGKFDLKTARKLQKSGLLKKIKSKRTSKRVDTISEGDEDSRETLETSLLYEEIEFEMYSAHEALRDLGKYHKLLNDRHEVGGFNGGPIQVSVVYETPK